MQRATYMTLLAAVLLWWGTPVAPGATAESFAGAVTAAHDAAATDKDGDDDGDEPDDDHGGSGGGDDADPVAVTGVIPAGSEVVRILDDDGYTPSTLAIDMGQQVTFVNQHHDEHTATGAGFDTGIIGPGATMTVTFDTPGTYAFACQFHEGMTGSIAVRDETGLVPQPSPLASAPPSAVAVAIIDLAFTPPTLTVGQGATVAWTNTGEASHTVSALDDAFGSDILAPGTTFTTTFDTPGTFRYVCRIHAEMQAEVIVTAGPAVPSTSPIPVTSPAASG